MNDDAPMMESGQHQRRMMLQLPSLISTFRPPMERWPKNREFYENLARKIRRVGLIRHHQVWTLSYGIKLYKDSFKGEDFVLWMMRSQNSSRPEALETGQCLMEHRLIEQIGWTDGGGRQQQHHLAETVSPMSPPIIGGGGNSCQSSFSRSFSSDRFYKLVDDEDQRAPLNALNCNNNKEQAETATAGTTKSVGNLTNNNRQTSISSPEGTKLEVSVRDFNARLCAVLERIYALVFSEDKRRAHLDLLDECDTFNNDYRELSLEANFVDIGGATAQERLAFFINMHNIMLIHITHKFGLPGTIWQRRKYLYSTYYKIGGHLYSLQSIFNGILRGNRRGLGMLWKPFGDQDLRNKFVIEGGEPLVHFGLNNYTRSTAPIRVYSTENVYGELKANARECLSSKEFLQIDLKMSQIRLAKLFKQYSEDFGQYTEDVLCWIVRLLMDTSEERMHLVKMLTVSSSSLSNLSHTVSYLPMDVDLNMSYGLSPPPNGIGDENSGEDHGHTGAISLGEENEHQRQKPNGTETTDDGTKALPKTKNATIENGLNKGGNNDDRVDKKNGH
uniref:DUF547 domain-containing protein n=1 Tax=Globodera pallida TaxID=36090 RepID=A0A183BV37_GLOPA